MCVKVIFNFDSFRFVVMEAIEYERHHMDQYEGRIGINENRGLLSRSLLSINYEQFLLVVYKN